MLDVVACCLWCVVCCVMCCVLCVVCCVLFVDGGSLRCVFVVLFVDFVVVCCLLCGVCSVLSVVSRFVVRGLCLLFAVC